MNASALTLSGQSSVNTAMLQARAGQSDAASKLSSKTLQGIDKSAQEFEGMFLAEMLSHMFEGVEVDPEFGGGHGEEMFRSMLVQEYGKEIAKGPGLGIAANVKQAMIAAQAAHLSPAVQAD